MSLDTHSSSVGNRWSFRIASSWDCMVAGICTVFWGFAFFTSEVGTIASDTICGECVFKYHVTYFNRANTVWCHEQTLPIRTAHANTSHRVTVQRLTSVRVQSGKLLALTIHINFRSPKTMLVLQVRRRPFLMMSRDLPSPVSTKSDWALTSRDSKRRIRWFFARVVLRDCASSSDMCRTQANCW